jgi:DNA (cytosine-5)-methyltransferase 1
VKSGLKIPSYPDPTTRPADQSSDAFLPAGPTCKEALGDLPDANGFKALDNDDAVKAKFGKPSSYAAEMRCQSNDAWHYGHLRSWNPQLMTSSARTGHSDISVSRFAATEPGTVEPISRFFKLKPDGLSNTLRAGTDGARGAFTSPRPIHYEYPRCVTVREMARLHGFPDWFRLHATKWHGARQIGNAVPPPLARAVAREVMKALGIRPRPSTLEVELGDPILLTMVMAEAARYFEVNKPNTKRDRKSGAKKRTQFETEVARLAALEVTGG